MPETPPFMDLKEFRSAGYLQEVNRRFFHPLGLALAVNVEDDGAVTLAGIYDDRDDPEGWTYGWAHLPPGALDRAAFIDAEFEKRRPYREALQGSSVQPLPEA
jgi:hypothetical protein